MDNDSLFSSPEEVACYKRRYKARGWLILVYSLLSFLLGMLTMFLLLFFL